MVDITLEIFRSLIIAVVFCLFCLSGRDKDIRQQRGWFYLVAGFGLILLGSVVDVTDNFPTLNKYIIIGNTEYQAFIEKVVGYLAGYLLLTFGFCKWLPVVIILKNTKNALNEAHVLLELKVEERTAKLAEEIQERKLVEIEKDKVVFELRNTFNEIKMLRGILPLCSYCKKIRNNDGYWEQVDVYIHQYSNADISHSLCPECTEEHYPEEFEVMKRNKRQNGNPPKKSSTKK